MTYKGDHMKEANGASARLTLLAAAAAIVLAACGSPPAAPGGSISAPARPTAATPAAEPVTAGATSSGAAASVRLAPKDPAMEAWKRRAAERIHQANQKQLFEGRPHHLLQAVIVVEATVDKSGNVVASRVTRSPRIKKLDDMALASLKAASPLPAPPASLLARGNLVFSETWLVQNDGTFQVRTLALPQE
jgi:periplasmic protein TonB